MSRPEGGFFTGPRRFRPAQLFSDLALEAAAPDDPLNGLHVETGVGSALLRRREPHLVATLSYNGALFREVGPADGLTVDDE